MGCSAAASAGETRTLTRALSSTLARPTALTVALPSPAPAPAPTPSPHPDQARVASVDASAAHPEGACCIAYCAADSSLLSGGEGGEILIFDLRQRRVREVWTAHSGAVRALVVSPGGACFSAASDGCIKAYDAKAAAHLGREPGEPAPPGWVQPAGAAAHDGAQGWGLGSGIGSALGRRHGVSALTLTERPTALVSGGADGKVKLWGLVGSH